MCGICGLATHVLGEELPNVLQAMNALLVHRGPDDQGIYVHEQHGVAMRRLSIIDVAGGHQPIFNENGRYAIVFNGEIYNFPELREGLLKQNHQFQTNSDTETILHLYEEKKEKTPLYLKGMFAFCIYDKEERSFFLARDRFGEKPLYYYNHPRKGFVFSSEIRSLLACPFVPRVLNLEALGYYLRMGYVPAPLTMIADVCVLRPGHWLYWQEGEVRIRPYYHINYTPDSALDNEADAIDAIRDTLRQAVKRQSISEVPLGAFLSGGIDSSTVAACLQSISPDPIKTFNVKFEEAGYDESPIARQVAERLGTKHHEIVIPNVSFVLDDFWRIVEHVGLPFLDTSAIPTYIISKQIRNHVTVALSGDGGDEMFAGYTLFQWAIKVNKLRQIPLPVLRLGKNLTGWMSQLPGLSQIAALRRVRRGLMSASVTEKLMPVAIQTLFEPDEIFRMTSHPQIQSVALGELPLYTNLPPEADEWTPLRRLMYLRLKNNLHDDMLVKVDRMSMATSLEVRAPMLDVDLAELSMRLPDKHLIRGSVGKFILRQAFRDTLPLSVFSHPKSGFSIPLHKFQNTAYRELANDLLLKSSGIMSLFSLPERKKILMRGINQKKDMAGHSVYRASHQLWGLMQLAAWGDRFNIQLPS